MGEGPEDDLPPARAAGLPLVHHLLDMQPLEAILAAAEIAWNDRIVHRPRELVAIRFRNMGKWPHDVDIALVIEKLRRHSGEFSTMEEIEQECLDNIVAVVAESTYQAADAVELVEIDFEPLPVLVVP